MTTFVALKAQAAARWRDANNDVIGDTQWGEYINQAYQHANTSSPLWPWLETSEQTVTVTPPSRAGTLPTDVLQVNWLYDTTNNYRMIPQEGRGDQWRNANLRTDTGSPVTYRMRASTFEVFPAPTAVTTYVAECVVMPARLAGSDLPVWPSHFHELLLDGALALAFLDDGNTEFHAANWGKFEQSVKNMLATILLFRDETNTPIRDVWWS